jgi:dTDP-4-amino-4,6-dideoxygalactose transaminase
MTNAVIPFNRPGAIGNELAFMQDAVARGRVCGDGAYTARCSDLLQTRLGVRRALLTTSCTHALEMAALLLDIQPGDEVIAPSFTFVSTVNAFVLRGARPVFADVRPDTLNLDETLLPGLLTPRTRCIVPVHYAGVSCEMDSILALATRHGVAVVEDNAHGLWGHYRGRALGTLGGLATLSFHETKNISCGEGGALLINDLQYLERAEILREKGTNRSRFFRGQVDKYTWVDVGSSYLPSDLLAAFLFAQLELSDKIQERRRHIWNTYAEQLRDWALAQQVRLPTVPPECAQAYHMFYLVMPSLEDQQGLIAWLAQHGIKAVFHYQPLHLSTMGLALGGKQGDCPVTEALAERLVRLPFYFTLTAAEQQRVIDVVQQYKGVAVHDQCPEFDGGWERQRRAA